jgi:DNA-binding MarR family transcriptional regulator
MTATPLRPSETRTGPGSGPAFLLAQLGAHAAERFAERLREHDLTPALVGILRLLKDMAGQSQQALAERLGMLPSRLVPLVDELEQRGLVRRERSRTDRRVNALQLTTEGTALLRTVTAVVRAHEASLLAAIDAGERATLTDLLTRISDQQGLTRGVHPGYREPVGERAPRAGPG